MNQILLACAVALVSDVAAAQTIVSGRRAPAIAPFHEVGGFVPAAGVQPVSPVGPVPAPGQDVRGDHRGSRAHAADGGPIGRRGIGAELQAHRSDVRVQLILNQARLDPAP